MLRALPLLVLLGCAASCGQRECRCAQFVPEQMPFMRWAPTEFQFTYAYPLPADGGLLVTGVSSWTPAGAK